MAAATNARVAQDSFLEALRSEIVAGTEILAAWVTHVQAKDGIEVLFELEAWLRGLGAFFGRRHLPLPEEERAALVTRSFAPEIRVARLGLQECERCALQLCSLGQDAKVEFEALVDTQIYNTGVLDPRISKGLEQATPIDSLAHLLESLNNLKVMIDALKDPACQDLKLFLSIGRTFKSELRNCRYVDMLLGQRFRLQFDRIDNAVLSAVLRSIAELHVRRDVSLALLYLYRFLHYLTLISAALRQDRPLRRFLVLFSLLHEQTDILCDFVKSRFLKGRRGNSRLRIASDLIVHSLRMEAQRLFERELIFLSSEKDASAIYAKVENSHGLLRNCYQSCVVTLIQAFDEKVDGKALFPSMIEGLQQGQRLRKDLWDLRQDLKAGLEMGEAFDLSLVLDRVTRFRESSLRYLMYQDWGEFERFSDSLVTAANEVEVRMLLRKFISFLEVLMQEVSKRSVLQ
jgi:hypothetical protein